MKKQIHACTFLITLFLASISVHAQTSNAFDDYVLRTMKDYTIPGIGLSLIKDGKIVFVKGYGYADIDKDIPYTPNTIQSEIASISKIIVSTAAMKLWEHGSFKLDDPVNNYLSFSIRNPFYPNTPITFRMLLNHTSSVAPNDLQTSEPIYAPGTSQELGSYLNDLLVPGGALYTVSESYDNWIPGTQYAYSNKGYALLAYLVQRIAGVPFDVYCRQNIFQPLCMNHTGWYYSQVDTNIVSRPYYLLGNTSTNQLTTFHLYETTHYPSNQLKTTLVDLSKFMLMHMNYGVLDGIRIIDSATEVLMRSATGWSLPYDNLDLSIDGHRLNNHLDQSLGFLHQFFSGYYNLDFYGWPGAFPGTCTDLWFDAVNRTGVIAFADARNDAGLIIDLALQDIALTLEKIVGDTISTNGLPKLNCAYLFNPCQRNLTDWKNNPKDWALNSVPMKLGTKLYYSKNQILDLLNRPDNGDASIVLAKALITAKFNVAQGSELSPIVLTINSAMNIIGSHRLPYDNPVLFSSPTGVQMLNLTSTLDSYNSGKLNTTTCTGTPPAIAKIYLQKETHPGFYSLSVFPNPLSSESTISFSLPQQQNVSITIFDANGRLVKSFAEAGFSQGEHKLLWNAEKVSPGTYVLRIETSTSVQSRKLIVIK